MQCEHVSFVVALRHIVFMHTMWYWRERTRTLRARCRVLVEMMTRLEMNLIRSRNKHWYISDTHNFIWLLNFIRNVYELNSFCVVFARCIQNADSKIHFYKGIWSSFLMVFALHSQFSSSSLSSSSTPSRALHFTSSFLMFLFATKYLFKYFTNLTCTRLLSCVAMTGTDTAKEQESKREYQCGWIYCRYILCNLIYVAFLSEALQQKKKWIFPDFKAKCN